MGSQYDPDAVPTIWRLPDDLWEECRPLLPPEQPLGTPGRPIVPFRRVLDGILYVLRTGCQGKAVPKELGAGSTCHHRFQEWVADGTWQRLWADQLQRYDAEHGIDWDWQSADSATLPSTPRRRRDWARLDQSGQVRLQEARAQRPAVGAAGGGDQRGQSHRHEGGRGHPRQPGRAAA